MALTPAQLPVLKAAIAAETDPTFVGYRTANSTGAMADWYNEATNPAFVLWRTNVSIRETGQAFNGAEWAGMTTANHTRLQTVAQYLDQGYYASLADVRAMFNDIWSGAGGATTRASLLALWKRTASKVEKIYATGTGSDASPATPTFEGRITNDDVLAALRS